MDNSNCQRCGKLLRVNEGKAIWVDTGQAILACDECGREVYHQRTEAAAISVLGGKNPFSGQDTHKIGLPLFDNYNKNNNL